MALRILHLDPDFEYSTHLGIQLMGYGVVVDQTTLPSSAAKSILDKAYDVLICELELEGIKGVDFIRGVMGFYPALKVIVLSRNSTPSHMDAGFTAGAVDFLNKTQSIDRIAMALQRQSAWLGRVYRNRGE
jgi:DNA-binding NtrC family response regulator